MPENVAELRPPPIVSWPGPEPKNMVRGVACIFVSSLKEKSDYCISGEVLVGCLHLSCVMMFPSVVIFTARAKLSLNFCLKIVFKAAIGRVILDNSYRGN